MKGCGTAAAHSSTLWGLGLMSILPTSGSLVCPQRQPGPAVWAQGLIYPPCKSEDPSQNPAFAAGPHHPEACTSPDTALAPQHQRGWSGCSLGWALRAPGLLCVARGTSTSDTCSSPSVPLQAVVQASVRREPRVHTG